MHIRRCSWATVVVTTEFMVHTMLTCTSQQYITMLQLCTIQHLLRITQRLMWELTSVTVFQTIPWPATHHAMDITMLVISDADKDSVLPLYMPSKRTRGILRNGSSLLFTCKTLIPQHYNIKHILISWAAKSCSGFCHVRFFTYLSAAKQTR